ncbi:MAG: chromosomal replication initiator protein DnaA, partial [Candidatus Levyibacteriota bacterium]
MDDLWNSILSEVQVDVSTGTFLMYFKKTKLVSLENNVATVRVPTFMVADQLEKKYLALLKSILDKKTGNANSIIFTHIGNVRLTKKDEGPLFAAKPEIEKFLNPRIKEEYGFESLAVSDSNQLAYTAALAVADSPGKKYNPLFIYGAVGVGKTHLMHSIANRVLKKNPRAQILYLTTEEFTNEVVEAIMTKSTLNVRKKFRHTDLLLLDDIQFLVGKDKVQEELFHTFNALIDRGGQIVFSSDRPPSELKKIEARLASRFEGGLTVDISPPNFELRCAIL